MRKKIKLFVSMLAAAAMLVLLPGGNALTARAEANTYSLKYIGGTVNDWRYVTGSTFEDGAYHRELGVLKSEFLKDGDNIVVYNGDGTNKSLDLSGFNLGSLTVHNNTTAVVIADSIRDCYVLAGAYTAITGSITNATLYDKTTCTFHSNVLDMALYCNDQPTSNISCGGTVGHFRVWTLNGDPRGEYYDIPANTMSLKDGSVNFPTWSPTPSESYLQARAAADGAAVTPPSNTSAPAAGNSSDDEYDEVPKTGEQGNIFWLLGSAAVLFTASFCLYRKTK